MSQASLLRHGFLSENAGLCGPHSKPGRAGRPQSRFRVYIDSRPTRDRGLNGAYRPLRTVAAAVANVSELVIVEEATVSREHAITQPTRRNSSRNPRSEQDDVFRDDPDAEKLAAKRAEGSPVYDPQALGQFYSRRPLQLLDRSLRIAGALGSVAVSILLDMQSGKVEANMRQRAVQLKEALTTLGPTFVKLGQALSTRPDLCPPVYLEELSYLQDQLPTFYDSDAFACIERELGRPLDSIFEVISPSPIAAASLGQVYKARLRETGATVAVKVQRPGITTAIGLDFLLIRGLCQLADKYVDSLNTSVTGLLDEFANRVFQELNYVQEARNARRFRQLYGDQAGVFVPRIVWSFTSTRVLCMEWVEGVKLSDSVSLMEQQLDVIDLVGIGIQCSLRQLLEFGYFHADPHPGNLLAMPDGRLAFLDFGMMSETPPTARFAIIGHVVHLVNRDYDAMAKDYYALDFLDESVDVTPIVPALRNFFDDVLQASVSELNFKTLVDGLGGVLYQFPFSVPAYYALIFRSLTVLEGLALYADPNFKVLAAAYPYFAKRLLTDPNPYLRDALIELLFKDGRFRWNRLENLLRQGRKDRDYRSSDALRPLLSLALGPDGSYLRSLIVSESVRVAEALLVGSAIATTATLPSPFTSFLPPPLLQLGAVMRLGEEEEDEEEGEGGVSGKSGLMGDGVRGMEDMAELRGRVLRCWALLQSSSDFDPQSLLPLVEIIQKSEVQSMGGDIAAGVFRRVAARSLQLVLQPPQLANSNGSSNSNGQLPAIPTLPPIALPVPSFSLLGFGQEK